MNTEDIHSAEIVVPCQELDATLTYFVDELAFRIESIYPADAPRVAVISGHGVRLRLEAGAEGSPGALRLRGNLSPDSGAKVVAPNGMEIDFLPMDEPLQLPPIISSIVIEDGAADDAFGPGRAGMQYRDLIPDRYGGRFIASHIRIQKGGPVPDYVHHHHIQFQLIFCVKGWVRVVYEDQGDPMLMEAGDCFLQPPHIRHRVLESSDQMEVVEISCPAEHETFVDHEMKLPTGKFNPERTFGMQKFVFHRAKDSAWSDTETAGLERQVTAIENATKGIVSVSVARARTSIDEIPLSHNGELRFLFLLRGTAVFEAENFDSRQLQSANTVAIPNSTECRLTAVSADCQYLEIFVPSQTNA